MLRSSLLSLVAAVTLLSACESADSSGPIIQPEPRFLGMVFSDFQQDPVIGLFSRAVVRVGLVPLLSQPLEGGTDPYRNFHAVFVPHDDAVRAYLEQQGISEEQFLQDPELATFIKNHIIAGNATGKLLGSAQARMDFDNLSGTSLTLLQEGRGCFSRPLDIDDCVFFVAFMGETARINDTESFQNKYSVTNGSIYIIDGVLAP